MPLTEELIYTWMESYGYPVLFVLLLSGIIGFPVPDEAVLLFTGVLIAKGFMTLIPAFSVSVTAVLLGSLMNYRIAAMGNRKWLRMGKKMGFSLKRWKKSILLVRKYGVWSIPFSYFIPGVRMGVSYGAGILQIRFLHYVISSAFGVVGWVGVYLSIGYVMG